MQVATKRRADVQLSVSGFMVKDGLEVLNGNIWDGNSSVNEVLGFELGEGLFVEIGFELLQDFGKFYMRKKV